MPTKWLYIVHGMPKDPTREAEFNDWYDNVHIPDILKGSPGFVKATRYESQDVSSTPAKYMTVYEIESDDIEETMKRHHEDIADLHARGRAGFGKRVAGHIYKQISK
ncbi:MAG: hypothetical protein HY673_23095 [Chloroflexi bacterium]|nr:hypothetical protein [Chloroflexota bacterium]